MTATLAPTLTARERRARLTARLKTLEAQSNEAIMYGDMAAWRDADEAWHRAIAALDLTPQKLASLLALVRDSGADFCTAIERDGVHLAVAYATAAYVMAAAAQEETRRAN
jgi:hypothetical protein